MTVPTVREALEKIELICQQRLASGCGYDAEIHDTARAALKGAEGDEAAKWEECAKQESDRAAYFQQRVKERGVQRDKAYGEIAALRAQLRAVLARGAETEQGEGDEADAGPAASADAGQQQSPSPSSPPPEPRTGVGDDNWEHAFSMWRTRCRHFESAWKEACDLYRETDEQRCKALSDLDKADAECERLRELLDKHYGDSVR